MEEMIKIPDERIGVLIGPSGKTKSEIIKKTHCIIDIDSGEGEVTIFGEGEDFFKTCDIVKAIGRGFSPERALKLLEEGYLFKLLDIPVYVGKNKSAQEAKRGRVIGKNGEARKEIEKKTHSLISVYGKTVGIIARPEDLEKAMTAVEMLLQGATHETVENRLEAKDKTRFEL
jgi:ribosomal RNA assembly protein